MHESLDSIFPIFEKWDHSVFQYLPKVFLALLVLLLFYFLAKIIRKYSLKGYLRKSTSTKQADIAKFVSLVIYIVLVFSGIFLALEILGLESVLTKVLAGAGIVGIIAGFAFKDIASNMFAGLLVNIQKPFNYNDWVIIDGNFGTILKTGWITTSIKSISGQEIYIPNQLIYNNSFKNFSAFQQRRIIVKSGVSHDTDLEKVKSVALDEISKIPLNLTTLEPDFYFIDIGDYAYNFEVRFWIKFTTQTDFLSAQSEAIMRIKKRFELEGINIAYPVQTLDFGVKGGVNLFDKPIEIKK